MTGTTVAHLLFDAFIFMMAVSAVIFRRALRGDYDPPVPRCICDAQAGDQYGCPVHPRPWDYEWDGPHYLMDTLP